MVQYTKKAYVKVVSVFCSKPSIFTGEYQFCGSMLQNNLSAEIYLQVGSDQEYPVNIWLTDRARDYCLKAIQNK